MKILIFRNDRLGDLIVTTPLLKLLKTIKNVKITLIVSNSNLRLAKNYSYLIDNYIVLEKKYNLFQKIKIYQKISKYRFDHVIMLRQNTLNMLFSIIFHKSVLATLSIDYKNNTNILNRSIYYYLTLLANHREVIDWRKEANDTTHISKHYLNLIIKSNIYKFNLNYTLTNRYPPNKLTFATPYFNLRNHKKIKSCLSNYKYIHLHLDQKWLRTESSINQISDMIKQLISKANEKSFKLILTDDNNNQMIKELLINLIFKDTIKDNYYLTDNGSVYLTKTSLEDLTSVIFISKITVTFHSGYIVHTSNSLNKQLIDFHEKTKNIVYQKWMSYQKDSKQYLYISLDDVVKKIINVISYYRSKS